jgi:hypothetical protein
MVTIRIQGAMERWREFRNQSLKLEHCTRDRQPWHVICTSSNASTNFIVYCVALPFIEKIRPLEIN